MIPELGPATSWRQQRIPSVTKPSKTSTIDIDKMQFWYESGEEKDLLPMVSARNQPQEFRFRSRDR